KLSVGSGGINGSGGAVVPSAGASAAADGALHATRRATGARASQCFGGRTFKTRLLGGEFFRLRRGRRRTDRHEGKRRKSPYSSLDSQKQLNYLAARNRARQTAELRCAALDATVVFNAAESVRTLRCWRRCPAAAASRPARPA